MLCTNTTNRITFKVGIHGTAALPTVRCMVGAEPALCFLATNIGGDSWEALIKLPEDFPTGVQPFRVEVQLNGRLFTPITREIDITRKDSVESKVTVSQVSEPEAVPAPVAPAPAPAPVIEPPKPRVDAVIVPRTNLPETKPEVKLDVAAVAALADAFAKIDAKTPKTEAAPIRASLPKAPELSGLKGLLEAKPITPVPEIKVPVLAEEAPIPPVEVPAPVQAVGKMTEESAQLAADLINSLSKVAEAVKPAPVTTKLSVPKAPALKGLSSFMIAAPVKIPSKAPAPIVEDIKISIADIANEALDTTE